VEYLDFAKPSKGEKGAALRVIARTDDNEKWDAAKVLLAL
jgi:hypothetical protein